MEKLTEKEAKKVAGALALCDNRREVAKALDSLRDILIRDRYLLSLRERNSDRYYGFYTHNSKNFEAFIKAEIADLENEILKLDKQIEEAGIIYDPNPKDDRDDDEA